MRCLAEGGINFTVGQSALETASNSEMVLESDADFVNSVMASQAVTKISGVKDAGGVITAGSSKTESASEGVDGSGVCRKQLLSGDECDCEKGRNKKLKQQPVKVQEEVPADISPDFVIMMKWMKQEFDGVKSDLTKTIDNRVDGLEEKLRSVMLTVVKEEVDKARQEFNDIIDEGLDVVY